MSDDFRRLVSHANPAARQYQPANSVNAYPPSSGSSHTPQTLDPFFDDDDDGMPDSAFGRPGPMQSQESGLPLARSAAKPAGSGIPGLGDGVPQGWNFDDDDLQPAGGSSPHIGTQKSPAKALLSRKWRWPWNRESVITGERVIALNNSAANTDFCSNFVSTSKYNALTFIPKFLTGMD